MTIHTLPPRTTSGKRPTVATPIIRDQAVHQALSSMDEDVTILRLAADSAALDHEEAAERGPLTEALYGLHRRMRENIDRLYNLL